MTELPSNFQEILEVPSRFSDVEDKIGYIKNSIIPRMDIRRGRTHPFSEEELDIKLNNPPSSDKPGEAHELARALVESGEILLSTNMALEIADVVYYELQPNSKSKPEKNGFLYLIMGDELDQAFDFCIVKYETRLKFGDSKDYKKIEEEIMSLYLEKIGYDSAKMVK